MRAYLRIFGRGIAAATLILIVHACTGKNVTDPNGKDLNPMDSGKGKPTKGLVGILIDPEGTPVKGAVVKANLETDEPLLKTGMVVQSSGDSAHTDSTGLFVFSNLVPGSYNIQSNFGNGKWVFFMKRVQYEGVGSLLQLNTITMRAPGKISGKVLYGEGDSNGVLCYVPGTSYFSESSDSGLFTLSGIPLGNYSVTYRKTGFKTTQDTGIVVKTEETSKLLTRELEADPAFPPPAPVALQVTYDTLTGKATLRWRKVKVDDLAGYVLYRTLPTITLPTRLGGALVKDTTYLDALFSSTLDSTNKEYTYCLKSQDITNTLSSNYSKSITIKAPSPTKVRTSFAWKTAGLSGDSASIGDSVTVSTSWSNPTRRIVKLVFYADNKSVPIATKNESTQVGKDSVIVSNTKATKQTIYVAATDEAGALWWDSLSVRYVTDAPMANAGPDTAAPIHTKIYFLGSATQTFGSIVQYLWDFDGDDVFDDSSTTGQVSHVYNHASSYLARLKVRDDDGNESSDFRRVDIINQSPVVNAVRADTTVTINDPIQFTGSGSDIDGPLIGYGWDFDGNGTLDSTSTKPFAPVYSYAKIGVYTAVFRVTDDDNDYTERSIKVTVIKDAPVATAGKDTTVSIKDLVRLHGNGTDKYGTIVAWAWDLGGTGTFKSVSKGDTIVTAPSIPAASWPCILRVTDDDGNVSVDTVIITVLKDTPTAFAGVDTTVSIGDTIHLSGKGTDVYGSIVERAWDIGATGTFRIAASGDTTIIAPKVATTLICSLRVVDDDGQVGKDIMVVNVVKDAPAVSAGRDTTIGVGQSLTLTGSATQNFGTVVMYKWDWQDNGSWDDSSTTSPTTTFTVSQGGTRTVLFGVRDDDSNFVVDTLLVHAVSYVGGTLSSSTTFYKSMNPYVLTADLVVPNGVDLVFSAGVSISGPYTILVKGGSLTAVGIAADSVNIASPLRFEGSNLSNSHIGYAMLSAPEGLQIGNNGLGAGPTQNSGTLTVYDATFLKNKITAEAISGPSKLLLRRTLMDSLTVTGNGTGILIEIISAIINNSTVQSSNLNLGIKVDSSSVTNTSFLLCDDGSTFTIWNTTLTSSTFKEAGVPSPVGMGASPEGPVAFWGCTLNNTVVDLPKSKVNIGSTALSFASTLPLVKIGCGDLFKAKFSGAGTGMGLEITGYYGNSVSGTTTFDSSEVKNFDIGVFVRNFSNLSMTGSNFVNNVTYDLENRTPLGFNALNCYWSGAASTVNVDTRIRDWSDDVSLGKVTFTPWSLIPNSF